MAGKFASRMMILGLTFALGSAARAADNDGDGVLDGIDVCCNTPPGVTVDAQGRPIGDLDADCDVDLMDFAIFAANLTGPLAPVPCAGCTDGQKNGSETDIDCGGGDCPPCLDGENCLVAVDCVSLVCQGGICTSSCSDGIENGNETDVDCGGGDCPPCLDGENCLVGTDCVSLVCQGGICTSSCSDGIENGNETDVDCGGGTCPPCANGQECFVDSDCQSTLCQGSVCVAQADGAACSSSAQCASGFCVDGVCCNGACSALCAHCDLPGFTGTCMLIPNGQDPDNECGGATTCDGAGGCTALLNNGSACTFNSQCLSGQCVDGVCCNASCTGVCRRCNLPGSVGSCAFIPNGQDPDNECPGTEFCSGAGSCIP